MYHVAIFLCSWNYGGSCAGEADATINSIYYNTTAQPAQVGIMLRRAL